jgi:hypothetical protein
MLDEGTSAAEAMTLAKRSCSSDSVNFFVEASAFPQTIDVIKTRAKPLGINIIVDDFKNRANTKTIILGSGFLAWVVYNTLKMYFPRMEVDVLCSSNQELWSDKLLLGTSESYDNVIDLSGKYDLGTEINLNNNALIVDAVGKAVSREEAQAQLWKACTTVKPSPRTPKFIDAMYQARQMIENGELEVDSFWTRAYNRNIEWQQAFADGKDRPNGYSRGYIKWD